MPCQINHVSKIILENGILSKFFGLVENLDLNMNAKKLLLCKIRDHNQNIPAGSKLRIRTGGANYVNKQVTVYKSNVFSTVVLIWNTVNT